MRIYISGISGTGMGPLAIMAKEAGIEVCGSDLHEGAVAEELRAAGIDFVAGEQDGKFLRKQFELGAEWFVHTSALPENHPELVLAKRLGMKISKRDELIAFLVKKMGLKMVAVAGTHGKTTTTAMIVWACLKLGVPISYLVGTTLGFAPSGKYDRNSKFLIYEADEYDRNFLKFEPWLAVITTVSYDHPDIYKTPEDYAQAFRQFEKQSQMVISGPNHRGTGLTLSGELRRYDARMAMAAVRKMVAVDELSLVEVLNEFPGVGRRFEKIAEGFYSDYAHHPEEIAATLEMAQEEASRLGMRGVVAVYEPHQNTRQHEVIGGYRKAFAKADKIFWLPTFLTRENAELQIFEARHFLAYLDEKCDAEAAKIGPELAAKLLTFRKDGFLILLMTAGPADDWFRKNFGKTD